MTYQGKQYMTLPHDAEVVIIYGRVLGANQNVETRC